MSKGQAFKSGGLSLGLDRAGVSESSGLAIAVEGRFLFISNASHRPVIELMV